MPPSTGPVEQALDALRSLDERFCAGELSVSELVSQAVSAVRGVEDHLIFDHGVASSRSRAFERVVGAVLADAGSSYGIEAFEEGRFSTGPGDLPAVVAGHRPRLSESLPVRSKSPISSVP